MLIKKGRIAYQGASLSASIPSRILNVSGPLVFMKSGNVLHPAINSVTLRD